MDVLRRNIRENQKITILFGIFLLFHIVFAVCLGLYKIDYHYDERLTFGLANNTMTGVEVEDGREYRGHLLYNHYLSVRHGESFDYQEVWENQAGDVHPPFYYVVIHTICSFFPEQYSKWFGLFPNIIFMLLTDFLIFQLAGCILKDNRLVLIATVAAGTTKLAMNMVLFIRMYAMMAFFVAGISMVFAIYFDKKKDWKFYIGCYLFAVGGIMTQYYYLIYLFFLCLFFGIHLLIQKRWEEAGRFIITFVAVGGSCIFIFPAMLKQILGGSDRGQQAFEAIQTFGNYREYLKEYYNIINIDIFGGLLTYVVVVAALFIIVAIGKKGLKKCVKKINSVPVMLLFAGLSYTALIAKIAPYRTDRYIMPIGWIFVLFFVWFLSLGITTALGIDPKALFCGSVLILFMCMAVNALRLSGWQYDYTFQSKQSVFDIVNNYQSCSVVCVYKKPHKTLCNVEELSRFNNYVFANTKNLEAVLKERQMEQMVLYIVSVSDKDAVISTVLEAEAQLKQAVPLYNSGYASVYYLD